MLKGKSYAKGASKYLSLKILQKIINCNYRLENAHTGVIQDYDPEEVRTEYFIKCNKRGEKESKLADQKEKIMKEDYYGTTTKLVDEFSDFMEEVYEILKNFNIKAVHKSCKRYVKKQNKRTSKGK